MAQFRLFELVMADGSPASPFVWRIKFSLAQKGLDFESTHVGLTEIKTLFHGEHMTVPILQDGNVVVSDSWNIISYLDKAYPQTPRLASTAEEIALLRLFDDWFSGVVAPSIFRVIAVDIWKSLRVEDQAYYRSTRELREGKTLEQIISRREERLQNIRDSLEPIRKCLARSEYLAGNNPGYVDYIVAGCLIWTGTVCTIPLLSSTDTIFNWFVRLLDCYPGLALSPRVRTAICAS